MSKFQEWRYLYPDDEDYPVHVRMKGKRNTLCGKDNVGVIKASGKRGFKTRKTLDPNRELCPVCSAGLKGILAEKFPMLRGWK